MELVGNVARRRHIQTGEITPRKKQATTPRKRQTVSRQKTPALDLDDWESCYNRTGGVKRITQCLGRVW